MRLYKFIPLLLISLIVGMGIYTDRHIKTIHVTENDLVRWCVDRTNEKPYDIEAVNYYCYELHGLEYARAGFKPNYDKYPPIWW
jgi:hypothetical protein